ncbi:MAG: hypothetical protein QOF21_1365 [Actinomycetota bacterium]
MVNGSVVVAVGDVICSAEQQAIADGSSSECQSEATAAVAKSLSPNAVLLAGDIQYERGRSAEFADGYDTSAWASLKDVTHASPGNHEYSTPNAAPYFAEFGRPPSGRSWYSFDVGGWHVISLNSNCTPAGGCGAGSPQETWLRADLAASSAKCTLAFWHHPRWSSGLHGSDESMETLWADLADADAEVVIGGHDHHYERFAAERGVRQFVVGTGGRSLYPTFNSEQASEVQNSTTFGVLELKLGEDAYSWRFVPIQGRSFTDSGTTACH